MVTLKILTPVFSSLTLPPKRVFYTAWLKKEDVSIMKQTKHDQRLVQIKQNLKTT